VDLREIRIDGVNWIQLAQTRFLWQAIVNMVMNLQVTLRKQDILL
jgi:hypothetical protein